MLADVYEHVSCDMQLYTRLCTAYCVRQDFFLIGVREKRTRFHLVSPFGDMTQHVVLKIIIKY